MEKFVKLLYDRLEGNSEAQILLTMIVDNAINEMDNNGILSKLPEDLQKQIHSEDPEERITVKTSIAKSVAYQNFIVSSTPIVLKSGEPAHKIEVKYRPDYMNSIIICIQGGLEGLYQSGIYKTCTDQIMHYYIETNASGDDYRIFRRKMAEFESLYENFQINFIPASAGKAVVNRQNSATPSASKVETNRQNSATPSASKVETKRQDSATASASKDATPSQKAATASTTKPEAKKGLFSKLFSKKK